MPNLPLPPSNITGELGDWLREVWRVVGNIPAMSYFSGTDPNTSILTGLPGHLAVNVGSASTSTRLWILSGSSASPTTVGWKPIRIA